MLLRRVPDRSSPPQPSTQGGPDMQVHHQGEAHHHFRSTCNYGFFYIFPPIFTLWK